MATRELAQRLSGGDDILLLWHPESGRIEVSVRDLETGERFEIEVAAAAARLSARSRYQRFAAPSPRSPAPISIG